MAKKKGLFDSDFFANGSGSDAWLERQKKLRQSGAEQQAAVADQIKSESAKTAAIKTADDNAKKQSGASKVVGAVGGFFKAAAIDVKDTTVGAYQGTKTAIDSIGSNSRTNARTDLAEKNNKEWNKFMQTLPEGDEKAWNDPANQEKLKEFRYKADLIQGKDVKPEDIPKSALEAQKAAATAHKNGTMAIDGTSSLLTKDPKTGKLLVSADPVDPYKQYREARQSAGDKKTDSDLQKLDAKKLAAQDAETFLNVATLGIGTGIKQVGKEAVILGGKELLEQGAKQTAKQAAKTIGKNIIGTSAKELAGNAAKDGLIGGAYGYTSDIRSRAKDDTSLMPDAKNILIGTTIGAAIPVVGKGAKTFVAGADKQVGKQVAAAGEKILEKSPKSEIAAADSAMRKALSEIGTNGVVGTLDKYAATAGRKVGYAASDLANKTKAGQAVTALKDDFMTKWVTNFHPLYKVLKRADAEGTTTGAYVAAREAIGNANRATAFAEDFLNTNEHAQQLAGAFAAMPGADAQKHLFEFDTFAKNQSETDLAAAGKKEFTKGKTAGVEEAMAKYTPEQKEAYGAMYKNLVGIHDNLNDFRLENGLISKEQHKAFKEDPFDYVRVQRELPDWLQDKAKGQGAGSKASISGTSAIQRLSKKAEAEQLSPIETMMKTVQTAHVEAYRNKAANTVYGLLKDAGEADILRSTDIVRAKQALLKDLHETKPIVTKLTRTLRADAKGAKNLQREVDKLSQRGLDISTGAVKEADVLPNGKTVTIKTVPTVTKSNAPVHMDDLKQTYTVKAALQKEYGSGKTAVAQMTADIHNGGWSQLMALNPNISESTAKSIADQVLVKDSIKQGFVRVSEKGSTNKTLKQGVRDLITADPAQLKLVRRMIETRQPKLAGMMDSIELMNRDLHELHQKRSGQWTEAQGMKTGVKKTNLPTVSFLDDGVENIYKTDPAVASAINNWTGQQQNVLNGFFRATNNIFKFGTTGGNIGFALPNVAGDIPGAFINSKNGIGFINPVTFLDSLYLSIGGKPMNEADRALVAGYSKGNKGATTINQYSKKPDAKRLAQQFAGYDSSAGEKLYTTLRHPLGIPRKVAETVDNIIAIGENTTRIQAKRAEKNRLLKKGVTEIEADRLSNIAARENSVDFLEMGEYGKVINSLFPYFNATIQGSRTMLRNLSERPVSTSGKIAAVVGVPTVATTVWNTSDKKRNDIYKTIPDYVKENNYIVVTPGAHWNAEKKKWDGVLILKKPPGFAQFAEPARKYVEYKANGGDEGIGNFLKENAGSIASDFGQAIQPIDFSNKWKFINSVTPQALKPTLQSVINKNLYTGQDIVPGSMDALDPKDQHYDNYSRLTGYFGNMFNVSPLQADSWIKSTFGELGTNAQHYIDKDLLNAPGSQTGGRSVEESITRRFSGAPGGADTDAFYSNYTKASNARKVTSAKVTALVKAGRVNEAKRRADEYNSSINDRFSDFMSEYKDSPTYDPGWDDKINNLPIKTSESAFKARRKVAQ